MRVSFSLPADQAGEVKPCPGLPLLPLHLPPPVLPPQEGVDGYLGVDGVQVWGEVCAVVVSTIAVKRSKQSRGA